VLDRRIHEDNNRAERDLRPTVIARKVSFGASSHAGAEARSVLMPMLNALNKRRKNISLESVSKDILDGFTGKCPHDVTSLIPAPPGQSV
jgi:DNA-binding transcriptional LysR family regulator